MSTPAWPVLGVSEHAAALRDSVDGLLERRNVTPTPSPVGTPLDVELWEEVCGGLGLGEVAALDNGNDSPAELITACFEVFGERLAPLPAVSVLGLAIPSVRCASALDDAGRWWSDVVVGRKRATVVFPTEHVVSDHRSGSLTVSGVAPHTVDGCSADILLMVAEIPTHGTCLLELDTTDSGQLNREREATFDLTREHARITMRDVRARVLGCPDIGAEIRATLATRSALLLAAEQLGGLSACLRMAVAHARTRFQFGRSIGSFQAIKHRLADMYMRMELTRTAVLEASRRTDVGHPDAELWATAAHRTASENFSWVATQALQLHGGLGFTWEHPLHLYLKRAKADEVMLNLPSERIERIADLLGL